MRFQVLWGGGGVSQKAQKLLEKPGKYYLGQMVAKNGIFYKLFLSAILTLRKIKNAFWITCCK